jgi:glycosyltransferase involved in cell wall biosynthesis
LLQSRRPRRLRPVLLAGRPPGYLGYLRTFVRYLARERPTCVVAGNRTINIMAVWARQVAALNTRVVVSEHVAPSRDLAGSAKWGRRFLAPVMRRAYSAADAIVAVSNGVAQDLAGLTGLPRDSITTIYNPVTDAALLRKACEHVEHPWLRPGQPPVVIGAGRLVEQKDFPLLVRAFAAARSRRPARLLILGAARDDTATAQRRAELMALAGELGVAEDVDLPGYVANVPAYLARAAVFALSSRYEGFGNVLVEAMACGCPVVSTDCPSGPAEVLGGGRFGRLVPVGDAAALADAIVATLDAPPDRAAIRARGLWFSAERAAEAYLQLIIAPVRDPDMGLGPTAVAEPANTSIVGCQHHDARPQVQAQQ